MGTNCPWGFKGPYIVRGPPPTPVEGSSISNNFHGVIVVFFNHFTRPMRATCAMSGYRRNAPLKWAREDKLATRPSGTSGVWGGGSWTRFGHKAKRGEEGAGAGAVAEAGFRGHALQDWRMLQEPNKQQYSSHKKKSLESAKLTLEKASGHFCTWWAQAAAWTPCKRSLELCMCASV